MNVESVWVYLQYDRADLEALFAYAKVHDVERNGRYDVRNPPFLNIWTHTWSNPGCKEESCLMCSLKFDWNSASLLSAALQPGYDWQVFCDELARLEMAALGKVVWGESRGEPIV
jgi:hypothetical protein